MFQHEVASKGGEYVLKGVVGLVDVCAKEEEVKFVQFGVFVLVLVVGHG